MPTPFGLAQSTGFGPVPLDRIYFFFTTEFYRVLPSFTEFFIVWRKFTGVYLVLLCFTEFYLVAGRRGRWLVRRPAIHHRPSLPRPRADERPTRRATSLSLSLHPLIILLSSSFRFFCKFLFGFVWWFVARFRSGCRGLYRVSVLLVFGCEGFPRVFIRFHWIWLGFTRLYWVLLGFTLLYSVFFLV